MASILFVFTLLCCGLFVNSVVNPENASNRVETQPSQLTAVLNYLNAAPVKVYNYKQATLVNAHTKADITELALDVSVECINNYPDLPCTEKTLICNAYLRGDQVLNDVKCVPKPEIIIEEPSYITDTKPPAVEGNETKSVALSNEAVSSEVGDHFVAVRRDSVPCLGCPFDLNVNAEGVDELVNLALSHLESERPNRQALVKVLKVQQQVVSGIKYILIVEVAPTVCTKETKESCPLDANADSTICQITYLQKPWITKAKHIINNNCTISQEFVAKKYDISNDIDVNAGRTKSAFADTPDFDRMAESGAVEMTDSRLEELESQIFVEPEPKKQAPVRILDDFIVPSTAQSEILPYQNQPLEDKPTIQNTEETRIETTPTASERQIVNDFVSAYYGSVDSSDFPQTLKNESEEETETTEQTSRRKRAVPQLEKIAPEEKVLVKNLADFVATALDNIDDDNHRRIILQILGAKKRMGDDGVYYHLILRMGVSRCLEDKPAGPNENCRDKLLENYTKICKVQVYVNDDFTSPKIVKSQCQNIKRDKNDSNRTNYGRFKRQMVGGERELDKNDEKVRQLLHEGVTYLNSRTNKDNKYKPVEVVSATSQVVAGVLYRIKTKIFLSDCSINDDKDFEECAALEGEEPKTCEIKVWEKPWLNFKQTTITCDGDDKVYKFGSDTNNRKKRSVPGGEFEASPTDKLVVKYLEDSLKHLDSESEHENKLKVHEIMSVTKQIVAGHIYRIKAKIIQSDCQKTSSIERNQCGVLESAEPKTCSFTIFEQLWVPNSRQTNITCENDQKEHSFRSVRSTENQSLLDSEDPKAVLLGKFNDFLKKYNKRYPNKKEYRYRMKVFSDNLEAIKVFNAYEQGTAVYGVTQFADLTRMEFGKLLGLRTDLRNENEAPFAQAKIPDVELPTEFDWRQKGAVTAVKNQEQCGSCWAFSVTGNVEGQYAIKHGKLMEFSEQELVDCDTDDEGCNGGLMDNAYRAIEKMGGLETEQDYPYDAEDEKCHFNRTLARVQLSGALNISHNETDMAKWLVANGPISIAINANAMQFYMGGVSHPFRFLCSPNSLDHGVLIVGYGVHTYPLFKKSLPYWIVKNSWGKSWGEQGYYRVYRGDGTCGLNQTPSSAIVA